MLCEHGYEKAGLPSIEVDRLSAKTRDFPSPLNDRFGFVSYEINVILILYDRSEMEFNATTWYVGLQMNKKSDQNFE